VLAYAVILLNTSIHNPNVKQADKMKFEQFVKMTKGIDNGHDINRDYLQGMYERVKQNEFKSGKDHTNSVIEFEKNLVGNKKPTTLFSLPHRRLVCIVQLYEVYDLTKKEKPNTHLRDCFLFNDILVVRNGTTRSLLVYFDSPVLNFANIESFNFFFCFLKRRIYFFG
jgi:IQ motif/SEC7 domain-containing protein